MQSMSTHTEQKVRLINIESNVWCIVKIDLFADFPIAQFHFSELIPTRVPLCQSKYFRDLRSLLMTNKQMSLLAINGERSKNFKDDGLEADPIVRSLGLCQINICIFRRRTVCGRVRRRFSRRRHLRCRIGCRQWSVISGPNPSLLCLGGLLAAPAPLLRAL